MIRCFYHKAETILVIFFQIRTVHLGIIKVIYSPTTAQMIVFKKILKFTLKYWPGSSVGIVTCYGLDGLGIESR